MSAEHESKLGQQSTGNACDFEPSAEASGLSVDSLCDIEFGPDTDCPGRASDTRRQINAECLRDDHPADQIACQRGAPSGRVVDREEIAKTYVVLIPRTR